MNFSVRNWRVNFNWIIPCLIALVIPLGARIFIHSYAPGFDEYESLFLYASDPILIFLLVSVSWSLIKKTPTQKPLIFLLFFLGFALISALSAPLFGFALYKLARLLLLGGYCLAVAIITATEKRIFERVLIGVIAFGIFESIIGLLQFARRESLGLGLLGESFLNPIASGVSKVAVSGAKVLRAYGTFPHPNVLSAFLLVSLFAVFYFWLRRPSPRAVFSSWRIMWSDLILALPMFIIALGLALTFSRTAWAITIFISLALIIWGIASRIYLRQAVRLGILLLAIASLFYVGLGSLLIPRASLNRVEQSVELRSAYNRLGISLIKKNPMGVGLGNQVFYAVKAGEYKKLGLNQVWQWQPIHNLYLLMASEIGLGGLISFLLFIGSLFCKSKNSEAGILAMATARAILASLLLFGLFDHFSWTLWQGQLMLWFAIGLNYGLFSKHQPSLEGLKES